MVAITDKIRNNSTGVRPTATTVTTPRVVTGTSLVCASLTGWATDTAIDFVTYKIDGQGKIIASSQTDFKGIVSGSTVNSLTVTGGTDVGNAVGDIVVALPTAAWGKDLTDALRVSLNQDGTVKDGAITTTAKLGTGIVTDANVSATAAIAGSKLADGGVTSSKWTNQYRFSAGRAASLSLPVASTVVPFDTVDYDTSTNFTAATGKFTAPFAGFYHFSGVVSASITSQIAWVSIQKNGSEFRRASRTPNSTTGNVYMPFSIDMSLAANDYVQIAVTIAGGGTGSIEAGVAQNYFTGHLISKT